MHFCGKALRTFGYVRFSAKAPIEKTLKNLTKANYRTHPSYLLVKIMIQNIPKHIAIILDGNGRWAKKHHLPTSAGHKAGADTLRNIANYAESLGVKYLTAYTFSTENWKRPQKEVDYLLGLLEDYIDRYIKDTKKNNMKFVVIGDKTALNAKLQQKIDSLHELSAEKSGLQLNMAINYGGKDEIVRAAKKIAADHAAGEISTEQITEEFFDKYTDTSKTPYPDLLIRTGGDMRLSNFLLWQIAYSELYFTDTLWPDFKDKDLLTAIESYTGRNRRFGRRDTN